MACSGTCHVENHYSWYSVIIFMGCYAVGELGHFLIGIVSKPIAQDIKFGEQGCIVNDTSIPYKDKQSCQEKNYTNCSEDSKNGTAFCEYNYLGSGLEYQLLAGPAFIAIFSVMGIILGIFGDMYNRVRLLTICVFGYSLMALLTGFSNEYWQLIILRFGFGAGEAGCTPLTASIVADLFGKRNRALAMSVFNWGIYIGYGLAFTVGNYVTEANINGKGWRWSYFLTGIPGFVMALLLILTVREPKRREIIAVDVRKTSDVRKMQPSLSQGDSKPLVDKESSENKQDVEKDIETDNVRGLRKLIKATKAFATNPAILVLLVGACVRHTASFCWSYNTQLYFDHYYPGVDIAIAMMLCSIVGGSVGIATGGIVSDLVVSKYGLSTRLWVLVVSQAIAAPFAAMVLYLEPPYCFITLGCAYLFAEMWYGVVITIFVEIVSSDIRSTAVATFAFIISNIGGNLPVIVTPLKYAVGGLRNALYITYPGFYLLSSVFFFFTQILIRRQTNRADCNSATITESSDKRGGDASTVVDEAGDDENIAAI